MKLLMLTNMYPRRDRPGYGIFVKRQVEAVRSLGHDIHELFVDGSRSAAMYLTAAPRLAWAVRRFEPDLVHAHFGLSGFMAAYPKHAPVVLSLCGGDVLGAPAPGGGFTLKSRAIRRLTRIACARADEIIVKSPEMGVVVERWGFRGIHVIPNGVDVDFFAPPAGASEILAARQRLALDPRRKYILFPSRVHEYRKRKDLAEQVTANVRRAGFDVELLGISERPQTILVDYYRACDLMLLTSETEGSPNVIKESMATALPSVSFDVGDVRSLSEGTSFHRVVPRHDVSAMTREAVDLLSREGQRGDGRDKIVRLLSGPAVARQVEAVYHQALGR